MRRAQSFNNTSTGMKEYVKSSANFATEHHFFFKFSLN